MKSFMFFRFITVATFFSFIIYVYPFLIFQYLTNGHIQSAYYSIFQTLIVTLMLIYFFQSSTTFLPIRLLAYECLGLGFIAFWVCNVALLIHFIFTINSNIIAYSSVTITFVLFIVSYFTSLFIVTKQISLKTNKISKDYCLALFSDLHLGSNNHQHLRKVLAKINEIDPDAVLISGDLIDSSSFNISHLKLFKTITVPVYFVTGNHEHYLKNFRESLDSLKNNQIIVLDNSYRTFQDLNIIGISDNLRSKDQIRFVNKMQKNNFFNICLVHNPLIWEKVHDKVDLMFSGHTHNGQIFPFNLFVRLKFKNIYGIYKQKKSILLVSSGASTWGPKMRLGSFNEIIELHIKKCQ